MAGADDRKLYASAAKAAASRDPDALVAALRGVSGPAADVIETLGRHRLIFLTLRALSPAALAASGLPPDVVDGLESWRARPRTTNRARLTDFARAQKTLADGDVPVLLLKGFHFATRVYGDLEARPQHDVDVLVRRRDRRRAREVLVAAGYRRQSYDPHAETFISGDFKLDVHWCLRDAPAFHINEDDIWRDAIVAHIDGLSCRVLTDEWLLVLLTLASFEELAHGLAKLRALMDLYLLVASMDATCDWDAVFDRRDRDGLIRVLLNVLHLVDVVYDAAEDWPRALTAIGRRRAGLVPMDRDRALSLVFAPRRHPDNLAWFGEVYPGSLGRYLLRFWFAAFPENLGRFSPTRLRTSASVIWRRARGSASPPLGG